MKKDLRDYMDEQGWIGHVQKDGGGTLLREPSGKYILEWGDGVQRMSMNHIFDHFLARTSIEKAQAAAGFWSKSKAIWVMGEPTRYRIHAQWYGMPGTFSGDQLEPYLWACVVFGFKAEFWEMWYKVVRRGCFTWNTKKIGQESSETKIPDFFLFRLISPTLRMIARTTFGFMLWPIILLWDSMWLGLNTIVRVIYPLIDREDTTDDINFVVQLVGSKCVMPTFASWLCTNLYLTLRPLARIKGDDYFNSSQRMLLGPQSAFNQYFNEEAAPPLNEKATWVILNL